MPLGEFELIARFFSRPQARDDVLLGVGDDAALLRVPEGMALVAAIDTLVEGRHFLPGTMPESIGHQALAVNLSDIAAMGASPAWALLSLSMPHSDEEWVGRFATGLHALAERFGVAIAGGDTVRGPLVITIAILGFVEPQTALRRDGARPGDLLYVSGSPGDAAGGLELLKSASTVPPEVRARLERKFLYAEPRIALGRALRGHATAAMDVSDGLAGDLAKLCAASGCGARIELDRLPISAALEAAFGRDEAEHLVLQGGDDYELLFTLPPDRSEAFEQSLAVHCPVHCIGVIESDTRVRGLRRGVEVALPGEGFDHFA